MTEIQRNELKVEIEKAQKTLDLMKLNAEKIKVQDDSAYQIMLQNNSLFEKHIEHMQNILTKE